MSKRRIAEGQRKSPGNQVGFRATRGKAKVRRRRLNGVDQEGPVEELADRDISGIQDQDLNTGIPIFFQ